MTKFITLKEAAALIPDGSTVGVSGFGSFSSPDSIFDSIHNRYIEEGSPKNLTIVSGVAPGNFDPEGSGLSKIKDPGLIGTLIACHLRMSPPIGRAISKNEIAGFSYPLGVYAQLLLALAANRPGVVTRLGLKTFVDPDNDGPAINEKAKAQNKIFVEKIHIGDEEFLLYKTFPIQYAVLRANYADANGNISVENEPVRGEIIELAMAVHNTGGVVIVEVQKIKGKNELDPRNVLLHNKLVDYVVVEDVQENIGLQYHPEFIGHIIEQVKTPSELMPLNARKIIARRAALELKKDDILNLGIGIPESVGAIVDEEEISNLITVSIETGVFGGIPNAGKLFGSSRGPESILRSLDTFAFYDGGGLDYTVLGAAIIDSYGNVNVSKFNGNASGPGGFIDISQNTPAVSFAFSFTAGKQDIRVEDGKLVIVQDGDIFKFKHDVEHVTFSGDYAISTKQKVLYITERCVFELKKSGLTLVEIAPGVDLEKHILSKMEFKPMIAKELKLMDSRIFKDTVMGLKDVLIARK
ncbi:acyl CoA:acetate/3-ketoacid CoA transferase [Peptoniphilaceae bacterium SGI.137]